jgi:hypothetical protein
VSDIVERLAQKIERRGPDECWPWTGATFLSTGYGRVNLPRSAGKQSGTTAHRALWATLYGEPHQDLEICHTCDNRLCCNPAHLFAGTPKINAMDKVRKGRAARIFGTRNGASKLTPDQVSEIRASNSPHRVIARKFGVSEGAIRFARSGETWGHV